MDYFLPVPEKLPKMVTSEIIVNEVMYDQAMVKNKVTFHLYLQLVQKFFWMEEPHEWGNLILLFKYPVVKKYVYVQIS